jgi:putative GTP pyrophosphokinase
MDEIYLKEIGEHISSIPNSIINSFITKIEKPINHAGILVRIFGRVKSCASLKNKLNIKTYGMDHKIQDLFGVRITVYFKDDIEICKAIMQRIFQVDNISEDRGNETTFKSEKLNIVCKIPDDIKEELEESLFQGIIDDTFEIQIRTVFSEGWHEVEHDMQYKCQNEWNNEEDDVKRSFNGIYATLITCDWAIIKLFDDRAYTKYKNKDWVSMLRNKFRIKFSSSSINEVFLKNDGFMKEVFKMDREQIVYLLSCCDLPLTMDNFLYIANSIFIKNKDIEASEIIEKSVRNILKNSRFKELLSTC